MAVLTGVTRLNVSGVLACSVETVMTTEAPTGDIGMIENGRKPCDRLVAVVAGVAGYGVIEWLSFDLQAVVTTLTITDNRRVVHVKHRAPG